jgi:hypothetical protein
MDLTSYLPREFPFYHLGTVTLDETVAGPEAVPSDEPQFAHSTGVAFQLLGELDDWLVLVFEQGLDVPTYTEMGNIIASQLATQLSAEGKEAMISPPRELKTPQLVRLLSNAGEARPLSRLYRHTHRGETFAVRAYLLAGSSAHA